MDFTSTIKASPPLGLGFQHLMQPITPATASSLHAHSVSSSYLTCSYWWISWGAVKSPMSRSTEEEEVSLTDFLEEDFLEEDFLEEESEEAESDVLLARRRFPRTFAPAEATAERPRE